MTNCRQCGKEFEAVGRSKYCSNACKQTFYRNRLANVTNKSVTIRPTNPAIVTKGKCWCCGKSIHPKTVCCYECAISGIAKAKRAGRYPPLLTDRTPKQMEIDAHTLKLTGGYQLTDFEREHYRPASELRPGELNPVTKPGDSHYTA